MGVRVSFFYNLTGDRIGGWSENYYNTNSQGSAVAALAQALGNALSTAKAVGVYWTQTRISVPGSPRNSITYINNPAQTSGIPSLTSQYSARTIRLPSGCCSCRERSRRPEFRAAVGASNGLAVSWTTALSRNIFSRRW